MEMTGVFFGGDFIYNDSFYFCIWLMFAKI